MRVTGPRTTVQGGEDFTAAGLDSSPCDGPEWPQGT